MAKNSWPSGVTSWDDTVKFAQLVFSTQIRVGDYSDRLPHPSHKSFFPTCQVRVVRFYVSLLRLTSASASSSSSSFVSFVVVLSALCRTSTATLCARSSSSCCQPPAGPQPRLFAHCVCPELPRSQFFFCKKTTNQNLVWQLCF